MLPQTSGNNTITTLERLKAMPGVFIQTIKQGKSIWFAIGELVDLITGKADKPLTGSGAPTEPPQYEGQVYVDTAGDITYNAVGGKWVPSLVVADSSEANGQKSFSLIAGKDAFGVVKKDESFIGYDIFTPLPYELSMTGPTLWSVFYAAPGMDFPLQCTIHDGDKVIPYTISEVSTNTLIAFVKTSGDVFPPRKNMTFYDDGGRARNFTQPIDEDSVVEKIQHENTTYYAIKWHANITYARSFDETAVVVLPAKSGNSYMNSVALGDGSCAENALAIGNGVTTYTAGCIFSPSYRAIQKFYGQFVFAISDDSINNIVDLFGNFVINGDGVPYIRNKLVPTCKTGQVPPTTKPDYVGQEYLDTLHKVTYKAYGTSSVDDWVAYGNAET